MPERKIPNQVILISEHIREKTAWKTVNRERQLFCEVYQEDFTVQVKNTKWRRKKDNWKLCFPSQIGEGGKHPQLQVLYSPEFFVIIELKYIFTGVPFFSCEKPKKELQNVYSVLYGIIKMGEVHKEKINMERITYKKILIINAIKCIKLEKS